MSRDDDDWDEGIRGDRPPIRPSRGEEEADEDERPSGRIDRDRDDEFDYPGYQRARARASVPGVLLVVCGILNVLLALYFLVNTIFIIVISPEDQQRQQEMAEKMFGIQNPGQKPDPGQTKVLQAVTSGGFLLASVLSVVLPILAGVRMRNLKSYGLCMTGAIVAAIPCVSLASCGVIGLVAGIWAVVVLLDAEVKAEFR